MSEKKYEDEISLKELMLILLKNKKLIMVITAIGTLTAIILSFVIISPVYETKTKLIINIPKSIETEIGVYHYPTQNITDYSGLLKNIVVAEETIHQMNLNKNAESFSKSLTITQEKDSKVVEVLLKGGKPSEIAAVLDQHVENYKKFLLYKLKNDAIDKFIKSYHVEYEQNEQSYKDVQKRILESEKLLSEMEPVISLRTALSSNSDLAAEFANSRGVSVSDLSGSMLQEEIVNPNYSTIEKIITENKVTETNLSIKKERLDDILNQLEEERVKLDAGQETEFLSILSSFVQDVSPAIVPTHPIAPRKSLNVAIGFVLSLMLGVFVAFFKSYWESTSI